MVHFKWVPRQRLQPGGSIIVVMTRWSVRDLTAKVLKKQAEGGADQWEVVEFPRYSPTQIMFFGSGILEERRVRGS